MPSPALEVHEVTHEYRQRRHRRSRAAVHRASLRMDEGESVALLGPNGSGKSTLIRLVCDALPVQDGWVAVFGHREGGARRRRLGVVVQSPALDRHLTVIENLRFQAALYGLSRRSARERIEDELHRANLAERARDGVKTLSGGLARRADLCRALIHRPALLLLDEPTSGLDPEAREAFLARVFERVGSERLSVLMCTHLIDEADRCDRVCVMHNGRIVADDAPETLKCAIGRAVLRVEGAQQPPGSAGIAWTRRRGAWWSAVNSDDAAQRAVADLARLRVPVTVAPPSLGDAYAVLTGAELHREGDAEHSR